MNVDSEIGQEPDHGDPAVVAPEVGIVIAHGGTLKEQSVGNVEAAVLEGTLVIGPGPAEALEDDQGDRQGQGDRRGAAERLDPHLGGEHDVKVGEVSGEHLGQQHPQRVSRSVIDLVDFLIEYSIIKNLAACDLIQLHCGHSVGVITIGLGEIFRQL